LGDRRQISEVSRKEAKKDRKKFFVSGIFGLVESIFWRIATYIFPSQHLFKLCGFFRLFAAKKFFRFL
jgi:hypothetical protein